MLSIQPPTSSTKKATPNLLPASIKHNGPIPTSQRYWNPSSEEDGTKTAYFRGRKLRGRTVKVPEGYEGRVIQKTEEVLPSAQQPKQNGERDMAAELRRMEEGDEDDEMEDGVQSASLEEVDVKIMETTSMFDEVVVWGHEMLPDDEDVYVKGLEEWIGFASAIHSTDSSTK